MIDPKQKLTRFSQVYTAKERSSRGLVPLAGIIAFRDVAMAEVLARADAVHESDAQNLLAAQTQYSISSVEEIVAIARIDRREKTTLVEDMNLSKDIVKRVETAMMQAPQSIPTCRRSRIKDNAAHASRSLRPRAWSITCNALALCNHSI